MKQRRALSVNEIAENIHEFGALQGLMPKRLQNNTAPMVSALMRAYAGKLIAPTSVKERAAGYGFASPVKSDLNVLKTVA